jgi:competence protein ComEA
MDPQLKSYFSFSRKERLGLMGLVSLIILLWIATFCMRYFVHAPANEEEVQLRLAWQQMQIDDSSSELHPSLVPNELFSFDPNTLDSTGFIRLGLNERTTHALLNWRNKGKHFYKKEEFGALYSLERKEYERLAPFINIANTAPNQYSQQYSKQYEVPLPNEININRVDSATLVRMKGIGPFLAHKIIERRKSLGGFLNHAQLLELYHFPDTTFDYLRAHLIINPTEIHKININSATEQELSIHPYIGEKMAHNIILLRSGLLKFDKKEQLRQVPLMNEEKYRKIATYCTIE